MRGAELLFLTVQANGDGYEVALVAGGATLGRHSIPEAHVFRDLARDISVLTDGWRNLDVGDEAARIGETMFALWLAPLWRHMRKPAILVIASRDADVLNGPWELARPPADQALGLDPQLSLRRLPWATADFDGAKAPLRPGPLRILFVACAPEELTTLDYEQEEAFVRRGAELASGDIVFMACELGTFDELAERIAAFRPHAVHLNGHAFAGDAPAFAFETEAGRVDPRRGDELAYVLARHGVRMAFVSGCETGVAPARDVTAGICQSLVAAGVPLVAGWAAGVPDAAAIELARVFYGRLASGASVDDSMIAARRHLIRAPAAPDDISWALPVLYGVDPNGLITDLDAPPDEVSSDLDAQPPLPGLSEGAAEQFVGRRREIQRLLPRLRSGELRTVFVTGMGGTGKSTLANRLARALERDGFDVVAIGSSEGTPLDAAALPAAEDLRARRVVVVVDNFEASFDAGTRRIADPDVARFVALVMEKGEARLIVTSRYLPRDAEPLRGDAWEESLGDFPEPVFAKFLTRDPVVRGRIARGELSHELLAALHHTFGGAPRFLEQLRQVLRTIDAGELQADINAVRFAVDAGPGVLRRLRDEYCEQLLVERLYGQLSPESADALARAAIFGVPFDAAAAAAVTDVGEEILETEMFPQWQGLSFAHAHPDAPRFRSIYSLLKTWLIRKLSPASRDDARHRAARWLVNARHEQMHPSVPQLVALMEARAHLLAADDAGEARALTRSIVSRLTAHGFFDVAERISGEMLAWGEHAVPLVGMAAARMHRGDADGARPLLERALAAPGGDDPATRADALSGLGFASMRRGDRAEALRHFTAAHALTGDDTRAQRMTAAYHLAQYYYQQGDLREAKRWAEQSMRDYDDGVLVGGPPALHLLASIAIAEQDFTTARRLYPRLIDDARRIGNRRAEASARHQLASVHLAAGDVASALDEVLESRSINDEIGDRYGQAMNLVLLSNAAIVMDEVDAGLRLVLAGHALLHELGAVEAPGLLERVARSARDRGISAERFAEIGAEAIEAWRTDACEALIRRAFRL